MKQVITLLGFMFFSFTATAGDIGVCNVASVEGKNIWSMSLVFRGFDATLVNCKFEQSKETSKNLHIAYREKEEQANLARVGFKQTLEIAMISNRQVKIELISPIGMHEQIVQATIINGN